MPLYDYHCHRCSCPYEAQRSIEERRGVECPQCGEPNNPAITFRGALVGLTTPGHSTVAWDHGGMWGKATNRESRHLKETREMLEAGAYKDATNLVRQSALALSRSYELAKKDGLDAEARSIEGRMARLTELRSKQLKCPDAPEELPGGLKRTRGKPTARRVRKKVATPDGKKDTTVTEIVHHVKYDT